MKKIVYKIRSNTKALMLGLSLFGIVGLACTFKKQAITVTPHLMFVGLVATFKKNKGWDSMDDNLKQFAEGMDVVLKNLATGSVSEEALAEKLTAFTDEQKKGMLTPEQLKSLEDTVASVKGIATEVQKLKDAGFEAHEVLPYSQAFVKALKEKKDDISAIKGNKSGSVNLSFKAAAVMGLGNVTNTSAPTMPGTTVMTGLNEAPRNQPFLIDLVDSGSVSTPTVIWYNKVNREDGTAFIAEGDLKPLSDFDIVGETATVKKIATRFNVSEEALSDIPFMESEIRSEGTDSLRIAIDDAILAGDGTGNNLKGIIEYAGAYTLPTIDDSTQDANEYDAILAGHTMLNTLNFEPNAVIVHPTTRFRLRTIKDKNGNYIIPPSADSSALNIDGLPVIAKNQVEAGKILMGDMKKSHVRFLMDINVRIGYDGTDFSHNRVTILVEARLMHFIKDVETSAFIYDDLSVIMAAIEAAAEA